MDDKQVVQEKFHVTADENRFFNRLENHYIAEKEKRLASIIAKNVYSASPTILEIGCGEGANLYYLSQEIPHSDLVGVDFSEQKIVFLQQHVRGAMGLCADATALPFENGCFDIVVCRDLLHHVNWNRDGVMAEAARVLSPSGKILVFESNGRTFLSLIFELFFPAERGMFDSTKRNLLSMAKRHGQSELYHVEASFLVRAFGFFLGAPIGSLAKVKSLIYSCAGVWEKLVEKVIPRSMWSYMMVVVQPDGFQAQKED